ERVGHAALPAQARQVDYRRVGQVGALSDQLRPEASLLEHGRVDSAGILSEMQPVLGSVAVDDDVARNRRALGYNLQEIIGSSNRMQMHDALKRLQQSAQAYPVPLDIDDAYRQAWAVKLRVNRAPHRFSPRIGSLHYKHHFYFGY